MDAFESEVHQVLVKLLDGKHSILNFNQSSVSVAVLKDRIQTLTSIPSSVQLLLSNKSRVLHDCETLTLTESCENSPGFPVAVNLLLRLRGGKGGFGSLLRGAATKAGQKKTNNFDACRDMSGRRLRHVNAEKKLEEWKAEVEGRKLEKMAEEFLKKKSKEAIKSGKANGGGGTEKYVAKYREDSAKCMQEVDKSVRESVKALMGSKRKSEAQENESASKRLKIWFGKRKLSDSDSEDLDEDDSDVEEENEESVVIDHGNHTDSSKDADASSGSVIGGEHAGSVDKFSSASESEEHIAGESLESVESLTECCGIDDEKNRIDITLGNLEENREQEIELGVAEKPDSTEVYKIVSQQHAISGSYDLGVFAAEVRSNHITEPVQKESVNAVAKNKPLNFDEYNSALELEVLGLEQLKLELQARGLKCGGSLQERAARLFVLKTTPLERIPKKLFAKI